MSRAAEREAAAVTGVAALVCGSTIVLGYFPAVEVVVNTVAICLGAAGLLAVVVRICRDLLP